MGKAKRKDRKGDEARVGRLRFNDRGDLCEEQPIEARGGVPLPQPAPPGVPAECREGEYRPR